MFLNPHKNLLNVGLSESMAVADFGAGSGHYTFAASGMVGNSGHVYAIDASRDLLNKILKESKINRIGNIHIIWADLEKEKATGLKDESIDLAIIANTLYQVGRKDRVAEEVKRVLRKKGRLFVVEWADKIAGIGPHSKHLVKKEHAISLFKKEGFILDREVESGDHHYGLLFRKN